MCAGRCPNPTGSVGGTPTDAVGTTALPGQWKRPARAPTATRGARMLPGPWGFRRRDSDGGGRDNRAPRTVEAAGEGADRDTRGRVCSPDHGDSVGGTPTEAVGTTALPGQWKRPARAPTATRGARMLPGPWGFRRRDADGGGRDNRAPRTAEAAGEGADRDTRGAYAPRTMGIPPAGRRRLRPGRSRSTESR